MKFDHRVARRSALGPSTTGSARRKRSRSRPGACAGTVTCLVASLVTGLVAGCSSGGQPEERASQTGSALTGSAPFLYLTCNATGYGVSEANRLQATSNPNVFALTYQVTQPWLVGSPDTCLLTTTNQLDGYGTSQTLYSDSHPSTPIVPPGGDTLAPSSQSFAVRYPATGTYVATVDWQRGTLQIAPPSTGVVGDCGTAPKGSDPSQNVDYVLVYSSSLSRWCVDRDFWSVPGNAQAITQFFTYGDAVYGELQALFHITPSGPFTYEVTDVTGGAHTGSDFGLGDTVTGDAFGDGFADPVSGQNIQGYWGYLLTLHEAINDFTGLVAPGWPKDWWADHRSPFPNTLDEFIMRSLGTEENNPTLLAAATAQHERFGDPTQPGFDPEVGMFDTFYNQDGGFSAFGNMFALVEGDGIQSWDAVHGGSTEPSPLLSEYVIAYLQLGIGTSTDLTQSVFAAAGVGSLDTTIAAYTLDSSAVRAIGDAHCSIRAAAKAGVDVSAKLAALQSGSVATALASGGTAASCPSECTWSTSTSSCVVRW